jgi:hypothetical protein
MSRIDSPFIAIHLYALLFTVVFSPVVCQEYLADDVDSNQLTLNVYVDESGRALINGYADNLEGLNFLSHSDYSYDKESKQLYAVSSTFTSKTGENWSLSFGSDSAYDEYHILFYLPDNSRVREVACSPGLESLVYASNGSFVAEVQGYEVANPEVEIEYMLPPVSLAASSGLVSDEPKSNLTNYLNPIAILSGISAVGLVAAALWLRRRQESRLTENKDGTVSAPKASGYFSQVEPIDPSANVQENAQGEGAPVSDLASHDSRMDIGSRDPGPDAGVPSREGIVVTREIEAVMNTLTDREKSVLQALLQRGGRMTQAEIGYETGISKSSLSGILTLMERRKMITKRQNGRTNIIEISNQLSNKSERS